MGKMKAYGEWAKEKGYLDQNYTPVDSNKNEMDFVDEYLKEDVKEVRVSNMASSHSDKFKIIYKYYKYES